MCCLGHLSLHSLPWPCHPCSVLCNDSPWGQGSEVHFMKLLRKGRSLNRHF